MEISDIAHYKISDQMVEDALKDQAFHNDVSVGAKTRADYSERDLIGSLGHQAVEQYFEQYKNTGDRYASFRKERRIDRGDDMDIFYSDDAIDVKSTHGQFDEQYFYNKGFLVYEQQLKDPKFAIITHFIFVLIDLKLHIAYIYGIIAKPQFMSLCRPVQLKHANQEIRAFQLTPLHAYVYHKQKKLIDFAQVKETMKPPTSFVDRSKADEPMDLATTNRVAREKRAQLQTIKKSLWPQKSLRESSKRA